MGLLCAILFVAGSPPLPSSPFPHFLPPDQKSRSWLSCLQITLEELQLGRSLLHRQAEAAIQQADAQIKLNKDQYDHVGRLLVHVKVAHHIQAATCRKCWGQPSTVHKCCCCNKVATLTDVHIVSPAKHGGKQTVMQLRAGRESDIPRTA